MPRTQIPLRGLTEVDLSRAIRLDRGAPLNVRAHGALAELTRRDVTAAIAPAMDLLRNDRATADDRLEAARTLGHVMRPDARVALVKAAEGEELVVRREAIRALGRVGGPEELQALGRLRVAGSGQLAETVKANQRLIAFRHGIEGFRFARPGRREAPPAVGDRTLEIRARPVERDVLALAAPRIAFEVPGLDLDLDAATELNCLGDTLLVLHSREAAGRRGAARLKRAPAIPMVVMAYAHCSERYYHYADIMSQPGDTGLELFVTRRNGRPSHFGDARIDDSDAAFTLAALRTPLAPPANFQGHYDTRTGKLTLDRAVVSTATEEMLAIRQKPRADAEVPLTSERR